jgi:hypothetical protein
MTNDVSFIVVFGGFDQNDSELSPG